MNSFTRTAIIAPADRTRLKAILAVCRESYNFYDQGIDVSTVQQLRNLLRQLAGVCLEVMILLESKVSASVNAEETRISETTLQLIGEYQEASADLKKLGTMELTSRVLFLEVNRLRFFKQLVRELEDRELSRQLASLLADMQMAQDGFKSIQIAPTNPGERRQVEYS